MKRRGRQTLVGLALLGAGALTAAWAYGPRSLLSYVGLAANIGRADAAAQRVTPRLTQELQEAGLHWGAPLLIRIHKLERELELWVDAGSGAGYRLFRNYPICSYSGTLGPKLQQGDRQAPEGFYDVRHGQMNPASQFHLSFDLGYPNAYDVQHGRTGDYLMVHGSCVSIGCYAMGDAAIEEIYTLMNAAFDAGARKVPVHAFPFRFDRDDVDARLADPRWGEFWRELRAGWNAFQGTREPPDVAAVHGHYTIVGAP